MQKKIKALKSNLIRVLIKGCLLFFCVVNNISYAAQIPEVIILYDQSGSMKKYDPQLISEDWLNIFIQNISKPCKVIFAGFDYKVHEYVNSVINTNEDENNLLREIKKINAKGILTDFEALFRYLSDRKNKERIKLILIISDGEPDIWDGKLRNFSKSIKSDIRYEALNRSYRKLKEKQLTPDELFVQLRHRYQEMNLELIGPQLSILKSSLGSKVLICDISADLKYLQSWSEKLGAQYFPLPPDGNEEPKTKLKQAVRELLKKSSRIVKEPLLNGLDKIKQLVPVSEEGKMSSISESPPSAFKSEPLRKPKLKSSPIKQNKTALIQEVDKGRSGLPWGLITLQLLLALAIVGVIVKIAQSRLAGGDIKNALNYAGKRISVYYKNAKEGPGGPVSIAVREVVSSIKNKIQQGVSKAVQLRQMSLAKRNITAQTKEAVKYIDKSIQRAIVDVAQLRDEMICKGEDTLKLDRRFSARVRVLPGVLEVYWTNDDGTSDHGRVVDASIRDIKFEAYNFSANSIDVIVCPDEDMILHVARSRIIRMDSMEVVVIIDEFKSKVDDMTRWVELVNDLDD